MSDERRVHARFGAQEVVRYDKAGKWFVEAPKNGLHPRRAVSVRGAAFAAVEMKRNGGAIYFGLSGGSRFDALARDLLAHEHPLAGEL